MFARRGSESFNATMIAEAGTIEGDLGNARRLGARGDILADRRRRRGIAGALHFATHLLVHRRGGSDHHRTVGGDDLRVDVAGRTVDAQPVHTQCFDGGAGPPRPPDTTYILDHDDTYFFVASLRTITSSEYFTPLPLYGSGGR